MVRPHAPGEVGEARRARRDALFRLDHVDDVKAEAAREVGPTVVISDDRRALKRLERHRPALQALLQVCREARLRGGDHVMRLRGDARQRLRDPRRDHFGVRRIEPVMRIGRAVRVA